LNGELLPQFADRGLSINAQIDPVPFRTRLSSVYGTWKERLGSTCWKLLAEATGLKA